MKSFLFVSTHCGGLPWQVNLKWSKIKIRSWKKSHILGNVLCCALLPWNNFHTILSQTNSQQMENSEPIISFIPLLFYTWPVLILNFFKRDVESMSEKWLQNTLVWAYSWTVHSKVSGSENMGLDLLKMRLWSNLVTVNLFRRRSNDDWHPLPYESVSPGKMDNHVSLHPGTEVQVRPSHSVGH